MKQIYSALTAIALFVSIQSNSQIFFQDLNNIASLPTNCWILTNTSIASNNPQLISGAQSILTHQTNISIISTPHLVYNNSITINFDYKLNNKLNNNATRVIEIGTTDKHNNFSTLHTITLNKNTNHNTVTSYTGTFSISGISRITIRTAAHNGDGNSTVSFDNLSISSADLHYSSGCNTAPVAVDDSYHSVFPNGVEGNVLTNDNTPQNNEVYSVELVQNVEEGDLNLNADGSFSYIPNAGFAGGQITFTYRINDGGFDPLTSNVATVTLNYAMQTVLPVKLIHFSGNVVNQKAELKWTLEANETGEYIQVEKSTDGKIFAPVAVVMNTAKAGSENYSSTDASLLTATSYYRLKMVNKTGTFTYSKVIVLKNSTEAKASTITVLRNPVQASIAFNYNSTETAVATINVYNAAGLKMLSFQHTMQKGINSIDKSLPSNFNNGSYIMEVIKNNERSVVKLVK